MSSGKPNILLIFSDEESAPAYFPPLNLPNRDRLRARGVEFTHNFCSNPLCSPSRATIVTGLWSHQAKVLQNADRVNRANPDMPTDLPTLGSVFSAAGYEVGYFGKWHLSWKNNLNDYGFSEYYTGVNENSGEVTDGPVADAAAKWLSDRVGERPWLCIVSFVNPHDVPVGAGYQGVEIPRRNAPLPASLRDECDGKHKVVPHMRALYRRFTNLGLVVPDTDEEWAKYKDLYCYLTEMVDTHLGAILDAASDLDNTITIYTSDHGDFAGAHGLVQKSLLYEEGVRVPLVVSYPPVTQGAVQSDALTEGVDLVPTLCELAGVQWPTELPGSSLAPMLANPAAPWRDCAFAESDVGRYVSPFDEKDVLKIVSLQLRMARTRDWKYIIYQDGFEELYDLVSDPCEMTNVASNSENAVIKGELSQRLTAWQEETADSLCISSRKLTVRDALGIT